MKENNTLMLEACFYPQTSYMAHSIYSAISSYSGVASQIIGGMGFSFQGLDKEYLLKMAKKFRNIELVRYEPYIDMYADELEKLYEKGNKQDG